MRVLIILVAFTLLAHTIFAQNDSLINRSIKIEYEYKKFGRVLDANKYYNRLSTEQKHLVCNINRLKPNRLLRKSSYWIPDTFIDNSLVYSPYPVKFHPLDSIKKAMLISIRLQAFGLYENGILVYWGAVSTGKKATPTPTGLHYMTFKKKIKVSTINKDWIMPWYFNIDVYRGIALHQYELPGYPASHGCIRMQERDAIFVYNWGDQWKYNGRNELVRKGTPVILFGKYNYSKKIDQIFESYELSNDELIEIDSQLSRL